MFIGSDTAKACCNTFQSLLVNMSIVFSAYFVGGWNSTWKLIDCICIHDKWRGTYLNQCPAKINSDAYLRCVNKYQKKC